MNTKAKNTETDEHRKLEKDQRVRESQSCT